LPYYPIAKKHYQREKEARMGQFIKTREKHGRVTGISQINGAHCKNK